MNTTIHLKVPPSTQNSYFALWPLGRLAPQFHFNLTYGLFISHWLQLMTCDTTFGSLDDLMKLFAVEIWWLKIKFQPQNDPFARYKIFFITWNIFGGKATLSTELTVSRCFQVFWYRAVPSICVKRLLVVLSRQLRILRVRKIFVMKWPFASWIKRYTKMTMLTLF